MESTRRDGHGQEIHYTSRRWVLVGIWLPVLVGSLARLAVVTDVRFTGEEALFYSEAHRIANGEGLPWHGPRMSGSGYHPGPLFFVIGAAPLLLSDDPALVHVWLVLLNMLAILLLARLTLRLHGVRAAAIVSAMLSSSPWQFVYSIGVWQPHVMLPIFVIALWCLERMKRVPRSWSLALLAPLLAASVQIHPSCIMVWLLAGVILVVQRPKLNWRALAVGTIATAAAYAPYLNHELRHNFENTRRIASDAAEYAWSLSNPARALAYHFLMTSGNINFHVKHGYWDPVPATLAQDLHQYWRISDPALGQLGRLWPVFALSGAITIVLSVAVALVWLGELASALLRRNLRSLDTLSLAFLASPVIVFFVVLLGRKPVYPNYVLFLLAAPFVGFVLLDRALGRAIKPRYNLIVPALAAILFLPRLGVAVAYVREVDARRGLAEQKAFARWVAERGPLTNVPKLRWYDAWVKEPIPLTIARCSEPQLLERQRPGGDRFTLAAEVLSDETAQRLWLAAQGVRGPVEVVEAEVRPRTTFLRWRRAAKN